MSDSRRPSAALQPPPGLELPDALWQEVWTGYGAPERAYHDLRHLRAVLERFNEAARDVGWSQPREVWLALLFHDAIYVPGAGDNEERSARLARTWIARAALDVDVARVEALIRLTARHGQLGVADVDAEEALFLDCDLAILGAPTGVYDGYEADVAREFSGIPPELYAAGRRAFLEGLLGEERLFLSPYFHARLDSAARENLRRVLARA